MAKPHDASIAARAGNEETARLLMERFRLDYSAPPAPLPPGLIQGFVCTQFHQPIGQDLRLFH
jgi:hypothetical protein